MEDYELMHRMIEKERTAAGCARRAHQRRWYADLCGNRFSCSARSAKEDAQEEVDEWQRFETILTPGVDDAHAVISITYTEQAQLLIGAVSMMPDNHFHTMRRDTVEKLKEIGVRLLRWPGWQLCRRISLAGYVPASRQARSHGGLHGK